MAVSVGVVEQGGKEIDGLNKRGLVVELVDTGIVACLHPYKSALCRWSRFGQAAQNLRERPGGDLAGSASAVGIVSQSFLARRCQKP